MIFFSDLIWVDALGSGGLLKVALWAFSNSLLKLAVSICRILSEKLSSSALILPSLFQAGISFFVMA